MQNWLDTISKLSKKDRNILGKSEVLDQPRSLRIKMEMLDENPIVSYEAFEWANRLEFSTNCLYQSTMMELARKVSCKNGTQVKEIIFYFNGKTKPFRANLMPIVKSTKSMDFWELVSEVKFDDIAKLFAFQVMMNNHSKLCGFTVVLNDVEHFKELKSL